MSRMSDAYMDVVEYVNTYSKLKVDREIVKGIIDSLDFDYAGGATQTMLMNKLENNNA